MSRRPDGEGGQEALAARVAELERENRLLREEGRQAGRIRRLWERSLAQLDQARHALEAAEQELGGANAQLEQRVAELKRAKEYVEHVAYSDKQVIEHMLEGVITTDAAGVILAVNPAFVRITGYDPEEVIGHTPRVLKSGRHDEAFYQRLWAELIERGRWQGEIWNRRKSGEVFPERLSIAAIHDWRGDTVNYIGVFTDISEAKRIEQALIDARNAAQEASRLKSQFLANMSHEVRTPMNAIIGMADLLSETPMEPEQGRFLNIMRSASNLLLTLIDDILDLAKVEAGQLELEHIAFDLPEVIEDVLEVLGVRARDKHLELHARLDDGVPEVVMSDPVRLRQVLFNLVGNAVKFTDRGGVEVRVSRVAGADGVLEFAVRDSGIGIPAERVRAIFSAFTQADASVTRRFGGTGLGLTICQRLVELMGGRIWVESTPGEGSTFFFTIPAQAAKVVLPRPALAALDGVAVLLAGGSPASRLIARRSMEAAGAVVEEEERIDHAMRCLERPECGGFAALVLDATPNGSHCVEVVEGVRSRPSLVELPIVVLGFGERRVDARRARELGVVYLLKPVKRRELQRGLALALGGEPEPEAGAGLELHGLKILLAEDSDDNVLLLNAYLRETPHLVERVENGEEAFERFQEESFDLVLMDVQMPVMDGYEATRRIRVWEHEQGRRPLPIIALTAHAMKEDRARSKAAGCTEHLSKPIRKADFLRAVNRYALASD
ncbi:PAS domain-containing hybrid sensor histidine kinase/response regulator [Endothiovibrio diazotrophicus]